MLKKIPWKTLAVVGVGAYGYFKAKALYDKAIAERDALIRMLPPGQQEQIMKAAQAANGITDWVKINAPIATAKVIDLVRQIP